MREQHPLQKLRMVLRGRGGEERTWRARGDVQVAWHLGNIDPPEQPEPQGQDPRGDPTLT